MFQMTSIKYICSFFVVWLQTKTKAASRVKYCVRGLQNLALHVGAHQVRWRGPQGQEGTNNKLLQTTCLLAVFVILQIRTHGGLDRWASSAFACVRAHTNLSCRLTTTFIYPILTTQPDSLSPHLSPPPR